MNGRLSPPGLPHRLPAIHPGLLRALALSLALHLAVIAYPNLGWRHMDLSGPTSSPLSPAFSATLLAATSKHALVSVLPAGTPPVQAPGDSHTTPTEQNPDAAPALGIGVLPVPGIDYFTTDQLTKRPQPVVLAELDTPETASLVASGKLVLKLWIDERGEVADVTVEHSNLPDAFARTAIAAFRKSRFEPGERGGLRVGTVMRIEISYDDGRDIGAR